MYRVQDKPRGNRKALLSLSLFRVLQDTLSFQPSSCFFQSPCLYPERRVSSCAYFRNLNEATRKFQNTRRHAEIARRSTGKNRAHIRSVWLEDICDTSSEQASNESVVPNVLPAFLHILLARLDTEKVTGRRIVRVAMSGTKVASGRESLEILRPPDKDARAKAIRQWTSKHCGCEGFR